MQKGFLLIFFISFFGCVAPNEIKQASSEVEVALSALREAQKELRYIYLQELEKTRQLVAQAFINEAIVRKVQQLSQQEVNGDLIAISEAINSERDSHRRLADMVLAIRPEPEDSSEILVQNLLNKQIDALRTSASVLKNQGNSDDAAKIEERANQLEESYENYEDYHDLVVLVMLAQSKVDLGNGLKDLDNYLKFLQLIHTQVHEWILTDLKVKGNEVSDLFDKHPELFLPDRFRGGQK